MTYQLLAAGTVGADPTPSAAELDALRVQGQRIYREGLRTSGEPLTATAAAKVRLSGKDAACVACHRRSGYGTSEGPFTIRPIVAPALLQEQTIAIRSPRIKARLGSSTRPPYNEELLARAIRKGIDAAGKPLDWAMPHYDLSDDEMKALAAYLFSLSAQPSPGVDEHEIHFATVIQPGVTPERRRAMLDIMQAFVSDKDANTRLEEQRRDVGNMRMYRAYRKWVLHVWDLNGPSDTWGAQLESYYRQQPVFALIGGLGAASWRPIQEFSERFEIPCVFPQVDLPSLVGANNYTIYFSRGVVLEAEVLAKFLRDQTATGKIVQVYRREEAGSVAAAALRDALHAGPGATLEDLVLEGPADETFWSKVATTKPDTLVLWLGEADLERATRPHGGGSAIPVYLSFNLTEGRRPEAALKAGANLRLVYPSDLPPRHDTRLLRSKYWMFKKGIAVTNETLQMNTLFAMTTVSDVVGHIFDSFSRDYFVERVEHVVGQTPTPSAYPQVSLGPGQRFAAKGSYIVQLPQEAHQPLKALSGWIVP